MTSKKKSDINFQIRGMELLDSSLNAPKEPLPPNPKFQFDLKIEHRISLEKKLAIVICEVNILNESKKTLYGQLRGSCIFHVENMEEFSNDNKQLTLPKEYIANLNSITISSIRGLMFSFFRGTFLHQAVLPIVDPQLMEKDKKIYDNPV